MRQRAYLKFVFGIPDSESLFVVIRDLIPL
jgi:hypothetical protein